MLFQKKCIHFVVAGNIFVLCMECGWNVPPAGGKRWPWVFTYGTHLNTACIYNYTNSVSLLLR